MVAGDPQAETALVARTQALSAPVLRGINCWISLTPGPEKIVVFAHVPSIAGQHSSNSPGTVTTKWGAFPLSTKSCELIGTGRLGNKVVIGIRSTPDVVACR
jgi:hypothetical protein